MQMQTTCTRDCPDRCSVICRVEKGRTLLQGDPGHPYTKGMLCSKILRHPDRLGSSERITRPWMRHNGKWIESSWDEALDFAAHAAGEAAQIDPGTLLLIRAGGSFGISQGFANYVFGLMGARFTRGNLCHAAGLAGIAQDVGGLDMNDPDKISESKRVVLWGKHLSACSVHTARQVREAREAGAVVAAVNPDTSAGEDLANFTLCIKPGSDRFLALALAKMLIERNPAARERLARSANGEAFSTLLQAWELDALLKRCELSRAAAQRLYEVYDPAGPVSTLVGWGLQRYAAGGENVRAIHALCYLAGGYEPDGGGFYYATNPFRHVRFPRPGVRRAPALRISTLAQDLASADPPVRFAWVSCSNLLNQGADALALREAFSAIETKVVVDAFWTDTALQADVVLPCALWLETEDVVGSYWHSTLGAVRRVVEPPQGCRSDFEILRGFAARLGLPNPYETLDEWLSACLPDEIELGALREAGWMRPFPQHTAWAKGFAHEDKRFHLLERLSEPLSPEAEYPLRLLSLIRKEATHSQIDCDSLDEPLVVRMHPQSAARAGVEGQQRVCIVSARGRLEARLQLDEGLHPDLVVCPRGGWVSRQRGPNLLTKALLTDMGDGTAFYETRVRVEQAGS